MHAFHIHVHLCKHVCTHTHAHTCTHACPCDTHIVGTGSMIAAISHVVQREPDYVVGKPSKAMLDVMKEM